MTQTGGRLEVQLGSSTLPLLPGALLFLVGGPHNKLCLSVSCFQEPAAVCHQRGDRFPHPHSSVPSFSTLPVHWLPPAGTSARTTTSLTSGGTPAGPARRQHSPSTAGGEGVQGTHTASGRAPYRDKCGWGTSRQLIPLHGNLMPHSVSEHVCVCGGGGIP